MKQAPPLTTQGSLLGQLAAEHQDAGHRLNLKADSFLCFDCKKRWSVKDARIEEKDVELSDEVVTHKMME